ncbi:Glycosyl hydrolase family 31 [Gaiella occulta]|uniref:Glycosyl hydrolase family 31 n=1 Tax=Gaiella occulta TaxID=1002870 RepID=A0A7M2YXS6_9ACTN|nr:TIM-barrel domain-containing protein [Gaiella occulta]RDI74277.1 Glycosyl hydrolase family 31 [Gaiella occulta]
MPRIHRLASALGALFLLALADGGSGSADTREEATWSVEAAPFRVVAIAAGKHVTAFGGATTPLVYVTSDGVEHRLTRLLTRKGFSGGSTYTVATDEPGGRTAIVTVRRVGPGLAVRWRFSSPAGVQAVRVTLAASSRDHFLGTGQRTRWVDMRRTVVPLKVWSACGSSSPSPFFASSGGFGAWFSTHAVGRIGFPGAVDDANFACDLGQPPCSVGRAIEAVRLCLKAASLSFEIVPGTIARVIERYAAQVGRPRAPWLPQLALIKWRDRVTGPGELFDDIEQMRSRQLPLGWILLDNPWEVGANASTCYGALRFDPVVFPDPKGMIDAVHAAGVRFMLWISPQIRRPSCAEPSLPDGWLTGDDQIFLRDLTLPASRADFTESLRRLVELGVDGFKGDRGDEVDLEDARLAAGPGGPIQAQYPLLYARAARDAMGGRPFGSLFRAFVPGSSSLLPGVVGPDAPQTFTGLSASIRAAQTAGVAGAPVWGSDVGGYSGGTLTAEVFARWAQFAALTPIFEVGGDGPNARFWELGDDAVEPFRAAATLHYELVPALYELARQASRTGIPVIRPLGLTWPADERAWKHDLEFTVGAGLLAAPVTTSGGADGRTTTSVYLPAGTWVDMFTGAATRGPATVERTSGRADFPLYLRRGSALAFNARTPALWQDPWRVDDLVRGDRQGWLLAPAAATTARAADRGSTLTARTDGDGVTRVTISRARREQQLVVLGARRTCGVESGSSTLTRRTAARLPLVPSGWTVETSRRRGIVVKIGNAPRTVSLRLLPCRTDPPG